MRGKTLTYIVIGDDERATLTIEPAAPDISTVEQHLRDMGWDKVYPPPQTRMVGWVSDVGHVMPGEFSRNIAGSLVMTGLGCNPYPLAGPLVITGYAFDEGGWPESLDDVQVPRTLALYTAVLDALGMPSPPFAQYRESPFYRPEFADTFRDLAHAFRVAPTPSMTVVTPDLR